VGKDFEMEDEKSSERETGERIRVSEYGGGSVCRRVCDKIS
jgi:hypothetical protein